ncbi:MAG TPA: hypothetical protein DF699_11950, partial [Phycisphaerales bacterium]|nr:hypothetical protein [Phycisphaerales bacterium]
EVLLELSRIGRSDEDFSLISCPGLINETIADLSDQIEAANATVRTHGSIPNINADTVRLRQVFENLIVNAIKYASEDTPLVLDIEYTNLGDRIRVDFTDNGPGVPEQYRELIFQLFQRLETDIHGTGVGLSIVRRVVEIHGGKVWIEDGPDGGARFCIELPVHMTFSNARAA